MPFAFVHLATPLSELWKQKYYFFLIETTPLFRKEGQTRHRPLPTRRKGGDERELSEGPGGGDEPVTLGNGREQGKKAFTHHCVVIVQPFFLGFIEHFGHNGRSVYGAESERFEAVEVTKIGGFDGRNEENVFDAHSKLSGKIKAGFVGDGHSGRERLQGAIADVLADLVRPFVHTEVRPHAVARAVAEVHSFLPEGSAGGSVELQPRSPGREAHPRERDVSFQYEGVDATFFVGERSEGDGAGDVRCPGKVLRPAVEQK